MNNSWIVLIPPIVVLASAFITKKVLPSLCAGIVLAAIIAGNFSPMSTASILGNTIWEQIDGPTIYTFAFLIILGALIDLMTKTGGTEAYGRMIKTKLHSKKSTESASVLLSLFFAIDDFFSCLTVGTIMRPLTDKFKIPRTKLAFLIDSLAAPLVICVPVSTWIAMLLMQLNKSGISLNMQDHPIVLADPFSVYLNIIPYTFYSAIILLSVIVIVQMSLSFGSMNAHETIAEKTGNLFGNKKPVFDDTKTTTNNTGSLLDFILPIGSLLGFVFIFLLYFGNYTLFGGANNMMNAIIQSNFFLALLFGVITAFSVNVIRLLAQARITGADIMQYLIEGIVVMQDSIAILFLAWTFSSLLKNDLQTGNYIAQLIVGSVSATFLPAMFFIASIATAVATGSSWGTIAVMIPLAVPMLASFFHIATPAQMADIPLLLPVIGSIFSGAVAGDHISPIGTTTVMSATSARCNLDDHVSTQLLYATPALIGTIVAYLCVSYFSLNGTGMALVLSLAIGLVTATMGLIGLQMFYKNRKATT